MAAALEGCGLSVAHVSKYISDLRNLAKNYEKVGIT